MERRAWIAVLIVVAFAGMARTRYVESYEGSRIVAPVPLDSALTARMLDLADCEILSSAVIRYDQRDDTALHETLGATRRDFKVSGDSMWLYRQEWVNRYFQPDSMIFFEPQAMPRAFTARMRQDQCIHSAVSGVFSGAVHAPQTLVVAPGDTLRCAVAQSYRLDGDIVYTDYTYTATDSVVYPVRFETVYWYAPGLRHPSAAWERYSYTGDSVPAVQYENVYVFPSYENSTVRPMATATPAIHSAAATGRYAAAIDDDMRQALSAFDSFTARGSFSGKIAQSAGTAGVTVEPAAGTECSVLLCDIAGRVLLSRQSGGEAVNIDRLPPGDYLLSVADSTGRCLRKIIIR